jgi:hypothetical protein
MITVHLSRHRSSEPLPDMSRSCQPISTQIVPSRIRVLPVEFGLKTSDSLWNPQKNGTLQIGLAWLAAHSFEPRCQHTTIVLFSAFDWSSRVLPDTTMEVGRLFLLLPAKIE